MSNGEREKIPDGSFRLSSFTEVMIKQRYVTERVIYNSRKKSNDLVQKLSFIFFILGPNHPGYTSINSDSGDRRSESKPLTLLDKQVTFVYSYRWSKRLIKDSDYG